MRKLLKMLHQHPHESTKQLTPEHKQEALKRINALTRESTNFVD